MKIFRPLSPKKFRGQTLFDCLSPKSGFTLIEVVMVILILGLLSVAGIHLMNFMLRNTFFLPNQVQANMVAADALEIMIEGDSQAKGLRFCKSITTAGANQIVFTNQGVVTNLDSQTITYNLSGGVLTRTIAPGGASMIPYFMDPGRMALAGTGAAGALFTYYDSNDVLLSQPVTAANVRRISINLRAQNGAGLSDNYQGSSQQSTSVKVYNL